MYYQVISQCTHCHLPPDRIVVAPDCGLKYLPREFAFGKMRAMVEGAEIGRREIAG